MACPAAGNDPRNPQELNCLTETCHTACRETGVAALKRHPAWIIKGVSRGVVWVKVTCLCSRLLHENPVKPVQDMEHIA